MTINQSIFRDYDIRGITQTVHSPKAVEEYVKWYGEFPGVTLSDQNAQDIGRAYGNLIVKRGGKKVVIGHEIRPHSDELQRAFIQGVISSGCSVVDIGPSLTPIIYFLTAKEHFDGGVMITGSHNVSFFNGFKMVAENIYPIYGKELQLLAQAAESPSEPVGQTGTVIPAKFNQKYLDFIFENFKITKKYKVVIDSGNGTAGLVAPKLFRALGCEVIELYSDPVADFPNHLPDPEDPFMLAALSNKVQEVGADIGFAFDADADRFGSVDETGAIVPIDHVLLVLAKDVLIRYPGSKILFDVKCSHLLSDLIPTYGGVPLMHPTGHAPIKHTLQQDQAIMLGGEVSGHIYHCENYYRMDDGIYTAVKMLDLLAKSQGKYSALFASIPPTIMTPELKLPCSDSIKHLVIESLTEYFSSIYQTTTLDGVRMSFSPNSWALVRASNTAPYLTIRVEADTVDEVVRIKNILADQLEKHETITDQLDRSTVTSRTGKLGWV
jgi:phosphomannomutase/phosphoglucomutase